VVGKQKDKATQSRVIYFDSCYLVNRLPWFKNKLRNPLCKNQAASVTAAGLRGQRAAGAGLRGLGSGTTVGKEGGDTGKGGVRDVPGSPASPDALVPNTTGSLPPPRAPAGRCDPELCCPISEYPQLCPGRSWTQGSEGPCSHCSKPCGHPLPGPSAASTAATRV